MNVLCLSSLFTIKVLQISSRLIGYTRYDDCVIWPYERDASEEEWNAEMDIVKCGQTCQCVQHASISKNRFNSSKWGGLSLGA